jgi:hypothetical protein
MIDYELEDFKDKLIKKSEEERIRCIYEWVKTGKMSLRQFKEIIKLL